MENLSHCEKLVSFLIPQLMAGGASIYGTDGTIYLKQLCRLTDQALVDYEQTREEVLQDNLDGKLHLFGIMSHFENCVNAARRALAFFELIRRCQDCPPMSRVKTKLIQIGSQEIVDFRNAVEHFDEEVQKKDPGPILLTIDSHSNRAMLGARSLDIGLLSKTLTHLHSAVKAFILGNTSQAT